MKHSKSLGAFFIFLGLAWATSVIAQARKPLPAAATDPQIRIQGYETHARMISNSKFKGLNWQWIGPKNVSGRVIDVDVVAPKGRNYTAYAATASGGLWKTENEGTTWEPVFDKGPSVAIGDVAVAPSDPRIVWIGTGEANIFRSSQAGIGVYKSADAGKTWVHRGLEKTSTIARIVVHPENPDVVYAAASGREWTDNPDRGVYKTTDGGATWTKALSIDAQTGAIDLVMDPSHPETLYASLWQRVRRKWNDPRNTPASSGSGIYKTVDGGKTWKPVNAGLPEAKFRGRIGLDLCRAKPGVLYALVDNYAIARQPTPEELGDSYGIPSAGFIKGATVYRSENGAETWVQTSGLTPEQKTFMERHSNTYGWVFGQLRVDPNDPDTVYTMGLMLNVSRDGGKTFARVAGPGVDHHALWIDPGNSSYMIKGFDQGAAVSYDGGANWRDFRDLLPVCQFFNVNTTWGRRFGSMARCRTTGASGESSTSAADATESRLPTSRERPGARARIMPSIRRIPTSSTRPASTEPSRGRTSAEGTEAGRRRSFCPPSSRASRSSEASGWRPSSSPLTARTSSISACSTSSGRQTGATHGSGSAPT